jgi:DNA-binding beta-propeller fold protein YncE
MKREQSFNLFAQMMPLLVVVSGCQPASETEEQAESDSVPTTERLVPQFEVDPSWPMLPNDWVLGSVASVDVDSRDHVWIYHRPRSVDEAQQENAAPAVLEFDPEGNFVQGWGGPGAGYEWPANEHGIEVDDQDYVWLGGNGGGASSDDMLLKFTRDGELVMQIGGRNTSGGNRDTDNLNRPAEAAVYRDTNEVFVADGYGNRRVIVFDADTGAYKRMWGAFDNEPIDASDEQPPPDAELGPLQFGTVHGIEVSTDGLVYVSDRDLNRIQVFSIDGSYQTQVFVNRDANANSVAGLAFSPDPAQQFVFVADLGNNHIHILDRETLDVLDSFGEQGLEPGQFGGVHHLAIDSQGNLYTAEAQEGRRAQKLVLTGMVPVQ